MNVVDRLVVIVARVTGTMFGVALGVVATWLTWLTVRRFGG